LFVVNIYKCKYDFIDGTHKTLFELLIERHNDYRNKAAFINKIDISNSSICKVKKL